MPKFYTLFFLLFFYAFHGLASSNDSFCINTPHRAWWDAQHYELHVKFNLEDSSISGYNIVTAKTLIELQSVMQLDLQLPMVVDSVKLITKATSKKTNLIPFVQENDVCYVMFPHPNFKNDEIIKIQVFFHGKPKVAQQAPWDGGLVVSNDKAGNAWWAVACQGIGASVWWPCKDFRADEPDKGVSLFYEVPKGYSAIGNGRLFEKVEKQKTDIWIWETSYPINLYNVTFYIGKYTQWSDTYDGENGILNLVYYVLPENLEKSKQQFAQVKTMLQCFEYWMGPYPFYRDGYKLVEAPYLGMEHQSGIAYGNKFQNGYLGKDRSESGFGLDFDFIIVHESGHEWFGNNISVADVADEWIHEGFTSYTETLMEECIADKEKSFAYQQGKKRTIKNDKPIQGVYFTCDAGSGDRYDKAGMMIHAMRLMIDDDSLFRMMLRKMNDTFAYQTISTHQILQFVNAYSGIDFTTLFRQYLNKKSPPVLAWKKIGKNKVAYRWMNCVSGFNMPIIIYRKNVSEKIVPSYKWQLLEGATKPVQLRVSPDYYLTETWLEK